MNIRFPDFDYKDVKVLAARLKKRLPPEHWLAFETVSQDAQAEGQTVYLVGGIVRDLFLGRENLDLDFVCLSDARPFARLLAQHFESLPEIAKVKVTKHDPFRTARLELIFQNNKYLHIDLTMARREIYAHPAALPTVDPDPVTLAADLLRRDFTINAMALSLESGLVDPFDGLEDLRAGWIRVLHPKSFEDDPTRMVRALRFAARFGYKLEPQTEELLKAALSGGFFALLSAERKRNELRLILGEARPEKALKLLKEYNLLEAIHSGLTWNEALAESFRHLRDNLPEPPSYISYLSALLHNSNPTQAEEIVKGLRFAGEEVQIPVGVGRLWNEVRPALVPGLKNSRLYALLNPFVSPPEILPIFEALLREAEPERAAQVAYFRRDLAQLKPELDGDFLIKTLGLKPGPQFKEWLADLRDAVLDGELQSREAEEAFLRHRVQRIF